MSFGNKVGRALGVAGALVVEGAVRGATGLGQFGADVVEGAEQGYTLKHAELLVSREAQRAASEAKRKQLLAAHAVALNVAGEPAPTTTRKVRA